MQGSAEHEHSEPTRIESLGFFLKSRVFIARRLFRDFKSPVRKHSSGSIPMDAPVIGEERSPLWTQTSPAELPLTAGKIQNLRVACSAFDGVSVPAGEVFSFW